jgi:hypothetical protein
MSIATDTSRSWSYVDHVDITDTDILLSTIYIVYKHLQVNFYASKLKQLVTPKAFIFSEFHFDHIIIHVWMLMSNLTNNVSSQTI